jgi:hypothetical protein
VISQQNRIKLFPNLGRSATEALAMIKQAFGKESMSLTQVFQLHAWFRADRKKARQVKSMLHIFFDIKGIVPKEFILRTSVTFYDNCVKMCQN